MLLRFFTHWQNSFTGIPPTVWLLSLISLINRCGGMVIAFLSLYMTQELHFSIRETGYILGCFGAGAMGGAFLGGRLTDRLGYYPVQFWSLVLNGIMLLLLMLVRDFWTMCLTIAALSLISEVFRPANSVAIALHCDASNRTRSFSLYRMSVNLGWTVAPVVGGLLAMAGWQWLFWVDGLTCMAAAVLLFFLIPNKKNAQATSAEEAPEPVSADRSPYRDGIYLFFILLTLLNAVVFMQIIWTVPIFFKEAYHWDEGTIGLMAALNGLIVFLVEMPLIYQIDGRRPPFYYIRIGLGLYALSYLAFLCPPGGMATALVFMTAISFGEIFVMPFSTNFAYGRAGQGNQGQYMGLYTMAYSLSNILAPLFGTQVIAAWGFPTLWWILIGLALLTWVGFRMLEKKINILM